MIAVVVLQRAFTVTLRSLDISRPEQQPSLRHRHRQPRSVEPFPTRSESLGRDLRTADVSTRQAC